MYKINTINNDINICPTQFIYFDLFLKKLPIHDNKIQTPQACQNVSTGAVVQNRGASQFQSSINIQPPNAPNKIHNIKVTKQPAKISVPL